MIEQIRIENFKSHSKTVLDLSNLNVFTGINGVGKSSVFQSLLLLRQSFEKNVLDQGLELNKPHCEIGSISDAMYQYAKEEFISFSLVSGKSNYTWSFKPETNDLSKTFIPIANKPDGNYQDLHLFSNNFQYLSAARLAPKSSYPNDTLLVETKRQMSIAKGQGELTPHFLSYWGKRLEVKFDDLIHPSENLKDLLNQTTAWEREISPNVNISPISNERSYSLKYSFNKPNDISSTDEFLAENVGFGLSYALPIIVSLLAGEKNSLIIIENPEAHLHPRSQSKLAQLISIAAQNGLQILLETHSDHIINGILVASKRFEREGKGINKEKIKFHHFTRNEEEHSTHSDMIEIRENGKLGKQPKDFFDQADEDLSYLLGF
ncbi:hypothetical protein GCM10007103_19700 [Salinimicrobium marinum]|uniref:ATPase n=1 Tax=Salinimicrobium marinum TaxID=680283 RepID=A0A918SF99_9FLAO|nr:DUF3696 domain-containing protein [Salinimicrobium marinum]GHA38375.1 hypothetical protein GCM10007103_19700 [Salinimicrobium marinum]